jgi:N-acetyl-alpha-D-glucosaminyl L-malate synthase BshA
MKIGISCYPTYGGSGVVATELGKNLAKLGHEVHFITYAMPYRLNQYIDKIFYHEVKVLNYPLFEYPPYSLALATKIAEISQYQKLDVVHVHYAIPHAVSAYLAREMLREKYSLKFVTTLHGTDITLVGRDPSFLDVTRFSIVQSDSVTAVSKYLKEKTYENINVNKDIRVIYNFIEDHPDQAVPCSELKNRIAPNGEKIISHLSNFRPVKRITDVIEVAAKVLRKMPVKVLMIGDGPERSLAESRSRELKIADEIIFIGKQDNVFPFLSTSDVFLMPSRLESFGLAALEAMACGVPCVTSNAGGLPELIENGTCGYTVDMGDVDAMADKVYEILRDDVFYEKLSKSTREYAFDNFHVSKIIPQYIEEYQRILS